MKVFNVSKIDNKSFIGRVLRFPLNVIPKSSRIKILQGYNRNYYWIVGSGVHGYWFGDYEFFKQKAISSHSRNGMIAYDVGAHVGFFTLLFARLCGSDGFVYAFEPNPRNLVYLRKHMDMNGVTNVAISPIALGRKREYMFFSDSCGSEVGCLSQEPTKLIVPVDSMDNLLAAGVIKPPDIIKIDVEGAELDVILGAERTLRQYKPRLFIAIDDQKNEVPLLHFLRAIGYKIEFIGQNRFELFARFG
jgi:FkbM family methyltransferase